METVNKEELKERRIKYAQLKRKEKMKHEAIKQMKLANFNSTVIKEFECNNTIFVSHLGRNLTKADETENKLIKALEDKNKNIKIYHLEQRKTERKEFLHYFYINTKLQNRVITEIRYL